MQFINNYGDIFGPHLGCYHGGRRKHVLIRLVSKLALVSTPQMWAKHFFVLTDEKLFFTEQQDKEEEPEKDDEPEVGVVKEIP